MHRSLEALANQELLAATHDLVRRGRAVEAELLRHLGEVDARRLYLAEACSSMFVYCVRVLHFSESAALSGDVLEYSTRRSIAAHN